MLANIWVYKCNRKKQKFARAYGDWEDVFRKTKAVKWGGSWCTNNPVSKNIMNELMRAGDLVLAYQTDDRKIVGVCRLVKITGKRNDRILWLEPLDRFNPPTLIHELKVQMPELRKISAFTGGFPQTVYAVSAEERDLLEAVCGVNLAVDASEPSLPPKSSRFGACFGNPETNRKVERAAVRYVSGWYRRQGWKVKSVEAEKCGYDLRCKRNSVIEHVEVKGIAGSEPCFNITASEVNQAQINPAFIIYIVTASLSKSPKGLRLTGIQLHEQFTFRPLQYHATPQGN